MTVVHSIAVGAALGALVLCQDAAASAQIATRAGCVACHAKDKKLIGPTWRDIAARNKGQPDAVKRLTASVRNGSKGVWGPLPMAPTDAAKLNDADLALLLAWILKGG